jgi:hypothetical protein
MEFAWHGAGFATSRQILCSKVQMRILVVGWFSWHQMGSTLGDDLSLEVACEWLSRADLPFDIALVRSSPSPAAWSLVDPSLYTHLLWVCGPFLLNPWVAEMLERFSHCKLIGLNISLLNEADRERFDLIIERDSETLGRPDLAFASQARRAPVVGLIQVHPQAEYKERAMHDAANAAIKRLTESQPMAVVNIDTKTFDNDAGLRSPSEIESLIARMDVVVTTRLHGMVFALRNGVPAIAIDPIAGGAKIYKQSRTIGWPLVFTADTLDDAELADAFACAQTEQVRRMARECAAGAVKMLADIADGFVNRLGELTACRNQETAKGGSSTRISLSGRNSGPAVP